MNLNDDYHAGFAVGLAYALAQNNGGKPTMTVTIPTDGIDFDMTVFAAVFQETLNADAGCFDFKFEVKGHYYELTIATTENEQPLPEDWDE